jgi:hypothetical protein
MPVEEEVLQTLDTIFKGSFLDQTKHYNAIKDIDSDIEEYEKISGNRLIIFKSGKFARTYKCGSHVACSFRAKFGKLRGSDALMLKAGYN